ncbi:MAG: acyl-CoA thioesterase [Phycisphaerae bacterium]|nr:acyl-CoA thioesterase [Phycisphaerae bacterium]
MSSRPEHALDIRVRYCECDPMGVAHHSVYPIWFEMGRTELLRAQGGNYRDLEAAGIFLAVVSLSVKYKRPAKYDDVLTLVTILDDVGHVKIEHSYRLERDGEVLATAETTLACLNRDGRAQPLPDLLRGSMAGRA